MTGPDEGAQTGVAAPPVGWYADPAGAARTYRWWDGSGWTTWLSADPTAPAPETPVPPDPGPASEPAGGAADPAPAPAPAPDPDPDPDQAAAPARRPRERPPGYERGRRSPAPLPSVASAAPLPSAAPVAAPGEIAPDEPHPTERHGPVRLMAVIAALAAAVVVAGVIILGNRAPADQLALPPETPDPASSSGQSSPTEASPSTGGSGSYDPASGELVLGSFRTTLPGAPYLISNTLGPQPPIVANGVQAAAVVQSKYDGSHDWDASLVVGELEPSLVVKGDASATADKVLAALITSDFGGVKVKKGTFSHKPVKSPNTERAVILQGRLNYSVPKVGSHYDQVSMLVLELSDGHWIGWVSSRPEKASTSIQTSLKTSIGTIRT